MTVENSNLNSLTIWELIPKSWKTCELLSCRVPTYGSKRLAYWIESKFRRVYTCWFLYFHFFTRRIISVEPMELRVMFASSVELVSTIN
eukprot:673938-Ditylum_brightwellii.AAC.1